jgi:FkbM family methyltransferase
MKTISEHSFLEEKIDSNGIVLDLGSGKTMSFAIPIADYVSKVIAVDILKPTVEYNKSKIYFENYAVSTKEGIEKVILYKDSDATSIIDIFDEFNDAVDTFLIEIKPISYFMRKYNVDLFEIMKMDIEGSEYEILNNLNEPIAKQISVEFHDFRGMNKEGNLFYKNLINKLEKWYIISTHKYTHHPGFPVNHGWNYWDSLFVLK